MRLLVLLYTSSEENARSDSSPGVRADSSRQSCRGGGKGKLGGLREKRERGAHTRAVAAAAHRQTSTFRACRKQGCSPPNTVCCPLSLSCQPHLRDMFTPNARMLIRRGQCCVKPTAHMLTAHRHPGSDILGLCCRIPISNIRGCYTEARRLEALATSGTVDDAPLNSSSHAWHNSDMKLTLRPPDPQGGGSGLWTVSGTGSDRDSRSKVSGIYNPSNGR